MLKEYLVVAQEALNAKKEMYQIKQQRLELAQQEMQLFNQLTQDDNRSITSCETCITSHFNHITHTADSAIYNCANLLVILCEVSMKSFLLQPYFSVTHWLKSYSFPHSYFHGLLPSSSSPAHPSFSLHFPLPFLSPFISSALTSCFSLNHLFAFFFIPSTYKKCT